MPTNEPVGVIRATTASPRSHSRLRQYPATVTYSQLMATNCVTLAVIALGNQAQLRALTLMIVRYVAYCSVVIKRSR